MQPGLLTAPFPATTPPDVTDWAAANGFSMPEVCCWPSDSGATRRYVPRLPGLGEVDGHRFFPALYRVGHDHVVCVEHEDGDFEDSDAVVKKGFLLAREVLAPCVR